MTNKFGEYIKTERLKRKMSLREFGEMCKISHTHIDSIEKGIDFRTKKPVNVTVNTINKIASALNIDPMFLVKLRNIDKVNMVDSTYPSENTADYLYTRLLDGAYSDKIDEDTKALIDQIQNLSPEQQELIRLMIKQLAKGDKN